MEMGEECRWWVRREGELSLDDPGSNMDSVGKKEEGECLGEGGQWYGSFYQFWWDGESLIGCQKVFRERKDI